jgi:hypothetical protein
MGPSWILGTLDLMLFKLALVLALAAVPAACLYRPTPVSSGPSLQRPGGRPLFPPDTFPPPRYGPECADAIARARADSTVRGAEGLVGPRLRTLALPNAKELEAVRGQLLMYELPVDSVGMPDALRAKLHNVRDRRSEREIRRVLATLRFLPARLDGCAVPSIWFSTFHFGTLPSDPRRRPPPE